MHEFHRRVGIGKCLKFSYTYIKIAIEMLEKLKSRIENASMNCSTRGFAPRCCNTCTHFQCLTLTFQVFVYYVNCTFSTTILKKYCFMLQVCITTKYYLLEIPIRIMYIVKIILLNNQNIPKIFIDSK